MANSKRIESLDIAKGIGILIVVLGHVLRADDVFLKKFIFSCILVKENGNDLFFHFICLCFLCCQALFLIQKIKKVKDL